MNNSNEYPLLCGTDTSSSVSNIILKKIIEAGKKKNKPYGDDDFTELAKNEFKRVFKNKNLELEQMKIKNFRNNIVISFFGIVIVFLLVF